MRTVGALAANVLWNQFRLLLLERVAYDRETFSYEEYRQRGLADNRLLHHALFMKNVKKNTKFLIAEFFMYQQKLIQ